MEELIQSKTIAFFFLISLKFSHIEIWDINRNGTTVDFNEKLMDYPEHENSTYDYGEIIRVPFLLEPCMPSSFEAANDYDYYNF